MSNENELQGENFETMSMGKLREYARHAKVAVAADADRETIVKAINAKQKGRVMAKIADTKDGLKPGYARIRIHENPNSDKQIPVYIFDNGIELTIPRGVTVDVPARIIKHLNNAVVNRVRQTEQDPGKGPPITSYIPVLSYPYAMLDINPGPQVFSKREQMAKKQMGPKRRYREKFGRWPRPHELTRAMEQGLIAIKSGEELSAAAEAAIQASKN